MGQRGPRETSVPEDVFNLCRRKLSLKAGSHRRDQEGSPRELSTLGFEWPDFLAVMSPPNSRCALLAGLLWEHPVRFPNLGPPHERRVGPKQPEINSDLWQSTLMLADQLLLRPLVLGTVLAARQIGACHFSTWIRP